MISKTSEQDFHIPTTEDIRKRTQEKNTSNNSSNEGFSGVPPEEKSLVNSRDKNIEEVPPVDKPQVNSCDKNIEVINTSDSSKLDSVDKSQVNPFGGLLLNSFIKLISELIEKVDPEISEELSKVEKNENSNTSDNTSEEITSSLAEESPENKICPFESKFLNRLGRSDLPENIKNSIKNEYEAKARIINQTSKYDARDDFHNRFLIEKVNGAEITYQKLFNQLIKNNNTEITQSYRIISPVKLISIEEAKIEIEKGSPGLIEIIRSIIEQSLLKGYLVTNDVLSDLKAKTDITDYPNYMEWTITRTITFAKNDVKSE